MFNYFDKTFFKIVGGFIAILCLSFLIFAVADYFQQWQSGAAAGQGAPANSQSPQYLQAGSGAGNQSGK